LKQAKEKPMTDILFEEIRDLLLEAKQAHVEYETNELGGKYDEVWAEWYANWLIKQGLNELLEQNYGVESLSRSLVAMAESQKESSYPPEKWADYYAATLLHEAK
jgi:hypothetical protein